VSVHCAAAHHQTGYFEVDTSCPMSRVDAQRTNEDLGCSAISRAIPKRRATRHFAHPVLLRHARRRRPHSRATSTRQRRCSALRSRQRARRDGQLLDECLDPRRGRRELHDRCVLPPGGSRKGSVFRAHRESRRSRARPPHIARVGVEIPAMGWATEASPHIAPKSSRRTACSWRTSS
jgi:hypothetical protein